MMEKDYKSSDFHNEVAQDIKRVYELYTKDPLVNGVLLFKLLEERENTNRVMKTLLRRIEELERKLGLSASSTPSLPSNTQLKKEHIEEMLSEADEKIVSFIKKNGKMTAKEVAKEMGYKGANAASARMNRLYEAGILKKKRIGKKVYFFLS